MHVDTGTLDVWCWFECLSLPETLAAATPAQTAGVGAGLSGGLGWGLDVGRLPFSHLHSTHTAGLHRKHKENEREKEKRKKTFKRGSASGGGGDACGPARRRP